MSYETLSRLVHAIGGSAKRREEGQLLGITAPDDPDRTPGGRPLIGKIGIGLFSVSQLSRRFFISTKKEGESYRLTADVRMRVYAESGHEELDEGDDSTFSGEVVITREAADDVDAHGTDVIIEDVKPRVRDLLRSADRWRALDEKKRAESVGDKETAANIRVEAPKYHTGWIGGLSSPDASPVIMDVPAHLPWTNSVKADARMSKLMDAVENEFTRLARPDLANTLDSYLQTIWSLSLSVPVKYVDKHPFDLDRRANARFYWLSNQQKGQAKELHLKRRQTVREAVREQVEGHPELSDGSGSHYEFRVIVDDIELKRPIRFRFHRTDKRGLDKAMLFVGSYSPNLTQVAPAIRGGNLALEGYLYWNGRVLPKENNGVLVRIRGASGELFDSTFFNYQVSEQTRLRQITSEIFIQRGLDAALNIDRESFNFSHPHFQLVSSWLHRAVRQLTNRHKDVAAKLRMGRQQEEQTASADVVSRFSSKIWNERNPSEPSPEIEVISDDEAATQKRSEGVIPLRRSAFRNLQVGGKEGQRRDSQVSAIARILLAFGLADLLDYSEQEMLLDAILGVFYEHPNE